MIPNPVAEGAIVSESSGLSPPFDAVSTSPTAVPVTIPKKKTPKEAKSPKTVPSRPRIASSDSEHETDKERKLETGNKKERKPAPKKDDTAKKSIEVEKSEAVIKPKKDGATKIPRVRPRVVLIIL